MNGKPDAQEYAFKVTGLGYLEALSESEQERIDLFPGDESAVSLLPCIPYGWQFKMAGSSKASRLSCQAVAARGLIVLV